jgi:hypothetical protein
MYAVIQDHEVIDYFEEREGAEQCALDQYDVKNQGSLYVVQIINDYTE